MNEERNKVRKSYFDSLYKSGSGGVHLVGGASALVSAWLVGPRLGRWQLTTAPPMGSPTNALIGRELEQVEYFYRKMEMDLLMIIILWF